MKTAWNRAGCERRHMACGMLGKAGMKRRVSAVVMAVVLVAAGVHAGSTIKAPMLDKDGVEQGAARVNLAKGVVGVKAAEDLERAFHGLSDARDLT